MNQYRLRSNGTLISERELREQFPMKLLPSPLTLDVINAHDADPVLETPMPTPSATQFVEFDGVGQDVQGNWIKKWKLTAKDPAVVTAELEQGKKAKNDAINKKRLELNATTFPYMGKEIAVDELSMKDILSTAIFVALNNAFPPGWPGGWKATDNSIIPLQNVNAFKNMFSALTAAGTTNFNTAQTKKAQLAAATTLEQVNAVNW